MPADPAKPSALPFAFRGTGKPKPHVRVSPVSKQILGQIAARSGFKSEGAVIAMLIDAYHHGPDAQLRSRIRRCCDDIITKASAARRQTVNGGSMAKRLKSIELQAAEIAALVRGMD
jgi:hypothetical protein